MNQPEIEQYTEDFLRNYILNPNTSIRNNEPDILPPSIDIYSLYDLPECPVSTDLISKRDPLSGKIIDFIEVNLDEIGEEPTNSMSFQRMPNPLEEEVRGSIMNFPFWPGGLKESKMDIEKLTLDDFDFGDEILSVPPDFTKGIHFEDDCINDDFSNRNHSKINLLDYLENEDKLNDWLTDTNENIEIEETNKIEKVENLKLDIDENILQYKNSPLLNISLEKSGDVKSEWVEMIDISQPVTDFEQRIPNPAKTFPFELDTFQKQAILHLEKHNYVFVSAHTSAGKTVVAEYAIALSRRNLTRTIYTSPIKALSNQKYRDFKIMFKDVGLITGDIQIDPNSSCLIMTTEILRSMLFCGSDVTRDLEFVILDECHYINDPDRGHVWEEVLIMLPESVTVILLSATVPNTHQFASWIGSIKKRKVYVISTFERPVPLVHYLFVANGGKVKDNLFCVVNSESKFKIDNYNQAAAAPKLDKKSSESSMWNKLIEHLKRTNGLPVIAFVLSRNRCNDVANNIKVNLNTETEMREFKIFFHKCLKTLKGSDQNLPQVIQMKNCLEKGIGVHHSGILPILKEIVEMCFDKGWVKILFATETFAMGVNMPAKTVVFDSDEKHDGFERRKLKPAEYIQMAGRAGRRGHDDTGTAIIICKRGKFPQSEDLRKMILGKPETFQSKFIIRYSIILTCLRLESLNVENILSHSYYEYHGLQSKRTSNWVEQLENEKSKLTEMGELEDHLQPLYDLYDLAIKYLEKREKLLIKALAHPKISRELKPGKVIVVCHGRHYNKLAVILSVKSKIKVLVLDNTTSSENDNSFSEDIYLWNKIISLFPEYKLFYPENRKGHCVIEINSSDIIEVTKHFINVNSDVVINDWNKRQMERFKNEDPSGIVNQIVMELNNLNDLYNSNSKDLKFFNFEDYIENLNEYNIVQDTEKSKRDFTNLQKTVKKANFEEDFKKVFQRKTLMKKIENLEFKQSWKSLRLYPEYCQRLNVLKKLGYVNENDEVELKGKIACGIGQNEIILTELIVNNVLHGLNPAEIAALLSSLAFQGKVEDEKKPELTTNLKESMEKLVEIEEKVFNAEHEFDVHYKSDSSDGRLNFGLVEVVYKWAKKRPFVEIMVITTVQEGIIVRCIQQTDEIIRDVKTAAKMFGNQILEAKMEEASLAIKRDIAFAASLYTTLQFDSTSI